MTPGIALYEFLPYGAPELHESARTNMSRATLLSSGLISTLFLLCLVVLPRLGEPDFADGPVGPGRIVEIDDVRVLEPPPLVPETPPSAPEAQAAADGIAVPVPDATADLEVTIPSRTGPGSGPSEQAGGGGGGEGGIARTAPQAEAWPPPDVYIYTDVLPDPVVEVPPAYPELARDARVEGTVLAKLLVGKDGRVLDVRIENSIPLLDGAAVEAARQWVFTPALANGRPVLVWVAVPFRFRLQ